MQKFTVGSICSGIEAASVAWEPLGFSFEWFSEIADFPSKILSIKYPKVSNLGDMNLIPDLIKNKKVSAPDILCGGTPCQAFSLAGFKNGLNDDRGNLTLRFVDIIEANDRIRQKNKKNNTIVFWENVEGVLTDKTNAFGCLISSLAGFDDVIDNRKWPKAGIVHGKKRNIAWRVLDAKYFGLPQQRRRLYLLAGGTDFYPEDILFEIHKNEMPAPPKSDLTFNKGKRKFEIFREYTDCLYSAYGTKWNGNAAAYNGSLFIVENDRIRRLSPLECERLMGFPDNYTLIDGASNTNRYQAIGNSWAVPVIKWIGERLSTKRKEHIELMPDTMSLFSKSIKINNKYFFIDLSKEIIQLDNGTILNTSTAPENCTFLSLKNIISPYDTDDIYISPVGCYGIVRRKNERNIKMNSRLEKVLLNISSQMSKDEIEKRSRVQKRGPYTNKKAQ